MTDGHDHRYALPSGHRFGEYRIDRYLGSGGFGITYLATDENLDLQVAIKEYLPADLAMRDADNSVVVKTTEDEDDFEWGRARFLDEARSLARFNHPNIVRVQRFFEAHGTSYIVMDYVEGEPLSELLERKGTLTEAEIRRSVLPLADGLAVVHGAGLLHRDIKPGNIVIRTDGTPVLIDFGSARQAMGMKSRSVTSVVTPGYAPLEQYATNSRQSPATDVYAFGAVLYRCVTGTPPDDATERAIEDRLNPAAQAATGGYSLRLLAAVDTTLALRMDERPQSMAGFLSDLGETGQAIESFNAKTVGDSSGTTSPESKRRRPSWLYALAILSLSVTILGVWLTLDDLWPQFAPDSNRSQESAAKHESGSHKSTQVETGSYGGSEQELLEPAVVKEQAVLVVTTEPEGAEVLITPRAPLSDYDKLKLEFGEADPIEWIPLGKSPLEQNDIQPGTYQVLLRHPYYQTVHLTDQALAAGKVLHINEVLEPGVGAVTVTVLPRDAWIEYDGKRLAETTPVTLEGLPAGELELTIGADGYSSAGVQVLLQHNEVVSIEQVLEPNPTGTLTLDLIPKDAKVTLPDVAPAYRPGIRLPQGQHRVVVSRTGYQELIRVVEVTGNTQERIELVPISHPFTVVAAPSNANILLLDSFIDYSPGMLLIPGTYRVLVSADGYKAQEAQIRHGTKATRRRIELKRLPRSAGDVFADALKSGGKGPAIVVVPAGRFQMGCVSNQNCQRDERPVHEVQFAQAFGMSKFQVTFAQWDACLSAGGCNGYRPDEVIGSFGRGRGNRPVYNLSWHDARAFASWLSRESGQRYRLPSEAEWEYAARAGSDSKYSWGAKLGRGRAKCCGFGGAVPVGSYAPNRWGLHDMHGNIAEWVEDCWNNSYAGAPSDGTAWKHGNCEQRVLRGGSWGSLPRGLRSADRSKSDAVHRYGGPGFRLVRELAP